MIPDSICILFSLLFLLAITQPAPSQARPYIAVVSWVLTIMARIDTLAMLAVPAASAIIRRRQWWFAILLAAGAAVAVFAISALKISDAGNVHGLDPEYYYIFKVIANALTNLFGIRIYTNTIAWCTAPVQIFDIGFLHLGRITQFGYCAPDLGLMLRTLTWYLVIFGIFPFVAIFRIFSGNVGSDRSMFLLFAAFYLMAPTFGKTIPRLFLYGYPLLIVIFPSLANSIAAKWRYPILLASGPLGAGMLRPSRRSVPNGMSGRTTRLLTARRPSQDHTAISAVPAGRTIENRLPPHRGRQILPRRLSLQRLLARSGISRQFDIAKFAFL
eukprot:gene21684-22619_t